MTRSAAAYRQILDECDIAGMRRVWAEDFPHLAQPANDAQAEIMMHHARTQSPLLTLKKRAWSHRWLTERYLPSGLPDQLKPAAERLYPRIAPAVGIIVLGEARGGTMAPAYRQVRESMEHAVLEAQADGKLEDSAHVTLRMKEARRRTHKGLQIR